MSVADMPKFLAASRDLPVVVRERNRFRRALKRIAKGYLLHNGVRVEYTAHFCKAVAVKALHTKSRNR